MKIFREVKGLPEPEEKKEDGEGVADTQHLEKTDEAVENGSEADTENVGKTTETAVQEHGAEPVTEEKAAEENAEQPQDGESL